jgi:TrmH family RNA methyltransferase
LAAPDVVVEVFATDEVDRRHPELRAAAMAADVPWLLCSGAVVDHLSDTVTPQGVVAVCRMGAVTLGDAIGPAARLVTILAQVRDPGNAGTVIRVSDASGADGVVLSHGSVDAYNAKCVRASAGSLFHLPVAAGPTAEEAVAAARSVGMQVFAADGTGDTVLDDIAADMLSAPTAWVFGNEAWGLPREVRALADTVVAVPIYGRAESLNLSTAAAVCLYASARAQRG